MYFILTYMHIIKAMSGAYVSFQVDMVTFSTEQVTLMNKEKHKDETFSDLNAI